LAGGFAFQCSAYVPSGRLSIRNIYCTAILPLTSRPGFLLNRHQEGNLRLSGSVEYTLPVYWFKPTHSFGLNQPQKPFESPCLSLMCGVSLSYPVGIARNSQAKKSYGFFSNGAGGIRTPGTLRHNGFQDRLLQPLGHRSLNYPLITMIEICFPWVEQGDSSSNPPAHHFVRSRGDSNPRYPFGAQLLSREPDSAALAPLQREPTQKRAPVQGRIRLMDSRFDVKYAYV
jgi:hypothetical protein